MAHQKPDSALKPVAEVIGGFNAGVLQSADDKIVVREVELDGKTKYLVASSVSGVDWVLCAVVDKATILSPLRSLLMVLVVAGLSMAVLGVLLANVALSRLLTGLFR